jgi:hypothetical protein
MRKRNLVIFVFLVSLVFLLISLILPVWKTQNLGIIKNKEILNNKDIESSPFVWKNSLKYFVSERGDKYRDYQLAIYDFKTKNREKSFGKGFGLGSATVIEDTLYVTATKNWDKIGKSEIYLIKSNDLKKFSEPKLIYKASEEEAIYNTSLTKNTNTGELILAYESRDDKSVPFTIYFLKSIDGEKFSLIEDSVFGKDIYVACPTIKFVDNYYYLFFGMQEFYDPNCLIDDKCRSFVTKVSKSNDFKNWITSPNQFMVADMKEEGINNSDVDLVEFKGKIYIFYGIGDQSKWQGIKYAVYNGDIKELLINYFH